MIPSTKDRVVASNGTGTGAEFGISLNDSAHIMNILRDTLYTDKVLAVLREYSSNAWDAHRMVGKDDKPIKVVLPTTMEPTLIIRDYGPGLSRDDVFQIYTQYGASTKRNSDIAVGMLGIGSKSGFAYSDSFTVTSYHGGIKSTYVAVLDKSEKGRIDLLCMENCGDETGVEIQIAVRQSDINEFRNKAQNLFQFFNPRPDVNVDLPLAPSTLSTSKHGIIYDKSRDGSWRDVGWIAIMGCIPYRINLDQLVNSDGVGVPGYLRNLGGALFFDIGEVQISASREELKYSEDTRKALIQKFDLLIEEYVRMTIAEIELGSKNSWEKRVKACGLRSMHLPIPDAYSEAMSGSVTFSPSATDGIVIERDKKSPSYLMVTPYCRIIIKDVRRRLRGYNLTGDDYLVRPVIDDPDDKTPIDWTAFAAKIDKMCVDLDIVGIPVLKLSEMPWESKASAGIKYYNIKHRTKCFKLMPDAVKYRPKSRAWDIMTREPSDDDVFVILDCFDPDCDLLSEYNNDSDLMKQFRPGTAMPYIYGYKTTLKKPIERKDCKGRHYSVWHKEFTDSLLTPEIRAEIELWKWSSILDSGWYCSDTVRHSVYDELKEKLGERNMIVEFLKKYLESRRKLKADLERVHALSVLFQRVEGTFGVPEAEQAKKKIFDTYPVLKLADRGIRGLWENGYHEDNRIEMWQNYVRVVDCANAVESKGST